MEPTGACRNCGDDCYEYAAFCDAACKQSYTDYLEAEAVKEE